MNNFKTVQGRNKMFKDITNFDANSRKVLDAQGRVAALILPLNSNCELILSASLLLRNTERCLNLSEHE